MSHHVLRDTLLMVGAVALFAVLMLALLTVKPVIAPTTGTVTERQSLIEYRAGERADWVNPIVAESQSLIDFRAAEREMR